MMHASSPSQTDLPLCGAKKFTYVTMNLDNVTCVGCIAMLEAKLANGAGERQVG